MTGLEKILSQIEQDSLDRCREISQKAQSDAEAVVADAEKKARELCAEKQAQTAKKLENIEQSAASSAELAKSRIVLKEKLSKIDETLERALDVIKALPKKEYFEILKGLVSKNVRPGEGVLHFSPEDTEKLPSNFIDSLNNSFKKSTKVKLGKSADIDSGFILVYGDIDINCSFDALAAEKRDELRDALNELLFK